MPHEITLSEADFDKIISDSKVPVLVDFWAPWSRSCQFADPILSEIAEEKAGKFVIGKLNVDDCPNIVERYGVTGIPTMIIFKEGKQVKRIAGTLPKQMLEQSIDPYIE